MTESVVALPNGSHVGSADSPRVRRTRTRARTMVTARSGRAKAAARRAKAVGRNVAEVMYLDAADSWIVRESTPSLRALWATDYAAHVPGGYTPFVVWCRAYRLFAVASAAPLHALLWLLVHPVRGPLFLTVTGAGITAAALTH